MAVKIRDQNVCIALGYAAWDGDVLSFLSLLFTRKYCFRYGCAHLHFPGLFLSDIQVLMGSLVYLRQGIENSPYVHLLDANQWADICDIFTRDACALLGLSVESPLSVRCSNGPAHSEMGTGLGNFSCFLYVLSQWIVLSFCRSVQWVLQVLVTVGSDTVLGQLFSKCGLGPRESKAPFPLPTFAQMKVCVVGALSPAWQVLTVLLTTVLAT